MEIREKIVLIMNEICNGSIEEHIAENLFECGILDSLTVMQLVDELRDAFDIDLDVDDITYDHFSSVDHIVKLVQERL